MRGYHYPRQRGMKGERKRGTAAIKEKETNEEGYRKTERRENAAKL